MAIHQHRRVLSADAERRAVDGEGRCGPYVAVTRILNDGTTHVDWYTPITALALANALHRAAGER